MPCSTVHAASASYPSPFPVIVPEFLSHVQVPWFCVSPVLCSFFFLMHCHWFSGHDANLLMILALLTGCWCLDYILLLHPPYIGLAFLSLSQRTFLAASISSLFPLSLIASFCFSPFLFFPKTSKETRAFAFFGLMVTVLVALPSFQVLRLGL